MFDRRCPTCEEMCLNRFRFALGDGRCRSCGARARAKGLGFLPGLLLDFFGQFLIVLIAFAVGAAALLAGDRDFALLAMPLGFAAAVFFPYSLEPDTTDAITKRALERRRAR